MIGLFRTYLMHGAPPKGLTTPFGCTDAPVLGFSIVTIDGEGANRRIFSPYHVWSTVVEVSDAEVVQAKPVDYQAENLIKLIRGMARSYSALGISGDFEAASSVIVALGGEPLDLRPQQEPDEPEVAVTKKTGGQEAATKLKRALVRGSKRGQIVELLMDKGGMTFEQMMKVTGHSRSNILSHLYCARRDNGIGYVVEGESISLILPEGLADPFEAT